MISVCECIYVVFIFFFMKWKCDNAVLLIISKDKILAWHSRSHVCNHLQDASRSNINSNWKLLCHVRVERFLNSLIFLMILCGSEILQGINVDKCQCLKYGDILEAHPSLIHNLNYSAKPGYMHEKVVCDSGLWIMRFRAFFSWP